MTVQKVCSSALYNIGSLGCTENNPFLDAVSLFLVTPDFEFATFTDFATQSSYTNAIKAGKMFPLHGIVEIEDNSEDAQYYEAPNGVRIPRRTGKYRHMYRFNKNLNVHKALQTFRNVNMGVIMADNAGNISAYSPDGTKVKGIPLSLLNPENMKSAGQDNTPAFTPLALDQKDSKNWNENGVFFNPTWNVSELEPVSDVEISVVSASAILLVLRVAYNVGIAPDGSDDLVGVAGIIEADFSFTDTSPTAESMTDNGDGTYNFVGVGMTTGSVDLASPATATSGGSPIESTGPAVITIA